MDITFFLIDILGILFFRRGWHLLGIIGFNLIES